MKKLSVLSILCFLDSIIAFIMFALIITYYAFEFWYPWIVLSFANPILVILAKWYRHKKNICGLSNSFLEVISIIGVLFNVSFALTYVFDLHGATYGWISMLSCIFINCFILRNNTSQTSVPSTENVYPLESPNTHSNDITHPRKNLFIVILLIIVFLLSFSGLAYSIYSYFFVETTSYKFPKSLGNIDIPVSSYNSYVSDILVDTPSSPYFVHTYITVTLDDSFSQLDSKSQQHELNLIASDITYCINNLNQSTKDKIIRNGIHYIHAYVTMETSNEIFYDKKLDISLLNTAKEKAD